MAGRRNFRSRQRAPSTLETAVAILEFGDLCRSSKFEVDSPGERSVEARPLIRTELRSPLLVDHDSQPFLVCQVLSAPRPPS